MDTGTIYTRYACSSCDAWYWRPFKNPGAAWYSRDERYAGRNADPILEPNWNHRNVISFLAPRTGRVLDVGCGIGNFLAHARDRGWQTRGIDFDPDAVAAGTAAFGLEGLEVNDLAGFREAHPSERFDLVTFFDVFEHLDNHREFLADVRGLLADGGYVAMSLPYRHGASWLKPYDLPPRHLSQWDRRTLVRFLAANGYTVRYITRRSEGIRFLILKLRFRYGRLFSFGLVGKAKAAVRAGGEIRISASARRRIGLLSFAAQMKDALLFGIPACLIWLAMLPSRKRYVTLYAIAQKNDL
jgi:SAM-dependent methyltransferase